MANSRLIRIVGNLCLITAILTQPVVGWASIAPCGNVAPKGDAVRCAGCGHCGVSERDDRCGCCQTDGRELVEKDFETATCCHESDSQPHEMKPEHAEALVRQPCHLRHPAAEEGQRSASKTVEHGEQAVRPKARVRCTCGLHNRPDLPPLPRAPAQDIKEVRTFFEGFVEPAVVLCDLRLLSSGYTHFSNSFLSLEPQRRLCVWRL